MSKAMGELLVTVDGAQYRLFLGWRAIGRLQEEFGQDLEPFTKAFDEGHLPNFGAIVRMVDVAMERYHPDAGPGVVDDILANNLTVFVDLMNAAFADNTPKTAGASAGKKKRAAA